MAQPASIILLMLSLLMSQVSSAAIPQKHENFPQGVPTVNPGSDLWREVRRRDGSGAFDDVNQGLLVNELFRELRKSQQMPQGISQVGQVDSGVLINIGRGVIVRLDDLVDSLREGEIGGAALDVFETEPLPPDHPLWEMDNVILTPHVAACSTRIAERHLEVLLDNVRRFANDQPLRNVADKRLWF